MENSHTAPKIFADLAADMQPVPVLSAAEGAEPGGMPPMPAHDPAEVWDFIGNLVAQRRPAAPPSVSIEVSEPGSPIAAADTRTVGELLSLPDVDSTLPLPAAPATEEPDAPTLIPRADNSFGGNILFRPQTGKRVVRTTYRWELPGGTRLSLAPQRVELRQPRRVTGRS